MTNINDCSDTHLKDLIHYHDVRAAVYQAELAQREHEQREAATPHGNYQRIFAAIENEEIISFKYRKDGPAWAALEERLILPDRLSGLEIIVGGHDLDRNDYRSFRLDRIIPGSVEVVA